LSDRELLGQAELEEPEAVVQATGMEDKMVARAAGKMEVKAVVEVDKDRVVVRVVREDRVAGRTMVKEAVVETVAVTGMAVEEGPRLWFSLLAL